LGLTFHYYYLRSYQHANLNLDPITIGQVLDLSNPTYPNPQSIRYHHLHLYKS